MASSGFRDFLFEEAVLRSHLLNTLLKVYRAHGFSPLETPALESLDLLLGRGGNENEKLIFQILKRGNSLEKALQNLDQPLEELGRSLADYGLRFDLTLPLARVYQEHRNALVLPWKVCHAGPVWRAERAQKGRLREFIQCDIDLLGAPQGLAELEVLQAGLQALGALGLSEFRLVLNDRRLVDAMALRWGFSRDQTGLFGILLDKKDKLSAEVLEQELESLRGEKLSLEVREFLRGDRVFSKVDLEACHAEAADGIFTLKEQLEFLELPIAAVEVDPFLVRGMGYYTGPLFELRHASEGYSFGGGGRYDGLVAGLPACGFSLGFERLWVFLQERQAGSSAGGPWNESVLFWAQFEEVSLAGLKFAQALRAQGCPVSFYPGKAALKTQLKWAEKQRFRWILLQGSEEKARGYWKLKDFQTGQEEEVSDPSLIDLLRKRLSSKI